MFVALSTVGIAVGYFFSAKGKPEWPGGSTPVGLAFGFFAAVIMLFEVFLWPRKKVRTWRIGTAKLWLRAHIWLGLLTVPLILFHSGFLWGGQLSTVLTILFIVVILSGLFGVLMQWILPRVMLEKLPAETIYSQIDHLSEENYRSAAELVAAACGKPVEGWLQAVPDEEQPERPFVVVGAVRSAGSVRGKVLETRVPLTALENVERLDDCFETTIGPYLLRGSASGSLLHSAEGSAAWFHDLKRNLPSAAHDVVDTLEGLCEQRREFDLQRRMHAWLHGWLCVHVPLAVALIGFMFVHAFIALKYW
jgi:hypothetical protein